MIKSKEYYPKTKRIGLTNEVIVTEKLDGSNLGFAKVDGELYVMQRTQVFAWKDLKEDTEARKKLYRGLYDWLSEHSCKLEADIFENAVVYGEWMQKGANVRYANTDIDKRFYMFAKANMDEDRERIVNLKYTQELFKWSFYSQEVPEFIGVVPVVKIANNMLTISELDELYDEYVVEVGRPVEGFIINYNDYIQKYVRYKKGKFGAHKPGK